MAASVFKAIEWCMHAYAHLSPTGRGAYRLTRAVRRAIPRGRRRGAYTLPGGVVMALDLDRYPDCTMAFGVYELETVRVLRQTIRPGDVVVDVGANIGYVTLIAAHLVGSTGQVHAFEPYPPNRERLLQNVALNGFGNITVHPEALGDVPGSLVLHSYAAPEANHGQTTAFPQPGQATHSWEVPAARLDDVLPQVRPALVKIDVEGCELAVLRGMRNVLRSSSPSVIVEFNPVTMKASGSDPGEFARELDELLPKYECTLLRWPTRRIAIAGDAFQQLGEVNLFLHPCRKAGS